MQTKLFKAFAFVLSTLVLLYALDYFFTFGLKKDEYNKVAWIEKMTDKHPDFAFMGASRVYTMVQTDTLEKRWNKKGINLALDGSNLMEQYLLLKNFLDNGNTMKDFFLGLDFIKMNGTMESDFRAWCFLPYIRNNGDIYDEFKTTFGTKRAFAWKYIPFYRYSEFNSKLGPLTVLNAFLKIQKPPYNKKGDLKEHFTKSLPEKDRNKQETPKPQPVWKEHYHYLELMMAVCKQHNVKFHIYSPPYYYPRYHSVSNAEHIIDSVINPLCKKYDGDFINYAHLELAKNPEYFSDVQHLNKSGLPFLTDTIAKSYFRNQNKQMSGLLK